MPVDAPKQIDLSQDLESQGIQLSQTEKASFQEYLNTLEDKEKQGIIYLTQQELEDFKSTLAYKDNHHNDKSEAITTFMQQQKNEGFSLSDMLGEDSERGKLMSGLEGEAQKYLFESDGIFKNLNISETAQDHMSNALILAVLKHLGTQETIPVDALKNPKEFFSGITENFGELKTLADTMIPGGAGGEHPQLRIAGMGEQNTIFMDPNAGRDFFVKILEGEMKTQDMESELENANTQEKISIDIPGLSTKAGEDIQKVEKKIQDTLAGMSPEELEEVTANLDEDNEDENWFIKMIKEFFAGIIKVGEDYGMLKKDGESEDNETEELTEEETNRNQRLIELFGKIPENKDYVKKLKGDPSATHRIVSMLESISADETWQETFEDIYGGQKGENIKNIFEAYNFNKSLPEGSSNIQKTLALLEEYSRYRNSDGVVGLTKGSTPWEDWAQKRQGEDWKVEGK